MVLSLYIPEVRYNKDKELVCFAICNNYADIKYFCDVIRDVFHKLTKKTGCLKMNEFPGKTER